MSLSKLYEDKKITLENALEFIESGDEILVGGGCSEPISFLNDLHKIADNVKGVVVRKSLDMGAYPYITQEGIADKISTKSFFLGGATRAGAKLGNVTWFPSPLSYASEFMRKNAEDFKGRKVFVCAVSAMDEYGYMSSSLSAQWEIAGAEVSDIIIFEINPNMPRVNCEGQYHISNADYVYEVNTPIPEVPPIIPTEIETTIGEYVASLVEDNSCIQLGIGGIPNATAKAFMNKKNLGIHTEMITSSMADLFEAGVVTGKYKNIDKGKIIGTFALGNKELYKFLTDNPIVSIKDSEYVNNPVIIAQNDNVVSINTALQVDLVGQVCSESIGYKAYSGVGGAFDFAYGAKLSKGGKSIIALPSTRKNGTISTIKAVLDPGATVSIPRHVVDYVVTEYGIAHLARCTTQERVEKLIAVSHPDFRDELRKQADEMMLF